MGRARWRSIPPNTFTGGVAVSSGTLEVEAAGAAGTGAVSLSGSGGVEIASGAGANISGLGSTSGDIDFLDVAPTALTLAPSSSGSILADGATTLVGVTSVATVSDAAGGTLLTASPTSFNVTNEASLNAALSTIDAATGVDTNYTITLSSGFTLNEALDPISITPGSTLTIVGGGGHQRRRNSRPAWTSPPAL